MRVQATPAVVAKSALALGISRWSDRDPGRGDRRAPRARSISRIDRRGSPACASYPGGRGTGTAARAPRAVRNAQGAVRDTKCDHESQRMEGYRRGTLTHAGRPAGGAACPGGRCAVSARRGRWRAATLVWIAPGRPLRRSERPGAHPDLDGAAADPASRAGFVGAVLYGPDGTRRGE